MSLPDSVDVIPLGYILRIGLPTNVLGYSLFILKDGLSVWNEQTRQC